MQDDSRGGNKQVTFDGSRTVADLSDGGSEGSSAGTEPGSMVGLRRAGSASDVSMARSETSPMRSGVASRLTPVLELGTISQGVEDSNQSNSSWHRGLKAHHLRDPRRGLDAVLVCSPAGSRAGSAVHGSAVHGSDVNGSLVNGSLVNGSLVNGSLVNGSVVNGSLVGVERPSQKAKGGRSPQGSATGAQGSATGGRTPPAQSPPQSAVHEPQRPKESACPHCSNLEAELTALRARFADELERQKAEFAERLKESEIEVQRAEAEKADEREQLARARDALQTEKATACLAENLVAELRSELGAEKDAAEGTAHWQQAALETATQLAEMEQHKEEAMRKLEKARKAANEAERQRRDLSKQSGTQEAQRLRAELDKVTKERGDVAKKLKNVVPRVEALQQEESKLQHIALEEAESAQANLRSAKLEHAEVGRIKETAAKMRRGMLSQVETLTSELADSRRHRHDAQQEVTREQRTRLDDARKFRGITLERNQIRAEAEQLREQLRWTEAALMHQANEEKSLAAQSLAKQRSALDNRRMATWETRNDPSNTDVGFRSAPNGIGFGITSAPRRQQASRNPPASGASGSRSERSQVLSSADPDEDPDEDVSPSASLRFALEGQIDKPDALADVDGLAGFEVSASEAEYELASPFNAAPRTGVGFGDQMSDRGEREKDMVGAEWSETPEQSRPVELATSAASETTTSLPSVASSVRVGTVASGAIDAPSTSLVPARAPGGPQCSGATARLMQVMEQVKERADQRRLLSGAAEEVRVKARALEELFVS